MLQIRRLGTFCHWKRIKKSSHKEMHFATINIHFPVSIHQQRKAAQKRLLGQECYMAERDGTVLEREGFMLTRWRNGIGHFSGDHVVFWEVKSTWRMPRNQDILHFSHRCNCRSILPLFFFCTICSVRASCLTDCENRLISYKCGYAPPAQKMNLVKR